jgi:beta-lactamase regulating signal transducer with metallopeptidase domain
MTHVASWFSPALTHALGWTLIHFIWEGAALAALFAAVCAFCRTAAARYALAVATLVLMIAAPLLRFPVLLSSANSSSLVAASPADSLSAQPQNAAPVRALAAGVLAIPVFPQQSKALLWFVEAWFAGVVLLSLRAAGGFWAAERLRREESKPVGALLLEKCLALQRRLRLELVIHYCECRRLDAPAVVGWFRPVVMLPVTALTGLSGPQLEAVIAHELAHIRRLDSFFNLFQIAAETLLFYHPAVWWVSQRMREERENCCDDVAISVCGDAVNYARALTLMEEWRSAPALAMAANRNPLATRVARLLGIGELTVGVRSAGFAASFLCLAGALLAGNAFVGVAHNFFGWDGVRMSAHLSSAPAPPPSNLSPASTASAVVSSLVSHVDASALRNVASRVLAQVQQAAAETQADSAQSAASSSSGSYIEQMKAAGFDNLTVEQLIALKTQGVTPEYVKAIHALGLKPSVEETIGMKVQGISPEYIRDMRAAGVDADINHLIGMKVQGLTPDYVKQMKALGIQPNSDELIGMKVQGLTPDYVKQVRALGLQASDDELIAMKVQGISPDYVQQMRAAGVDAKIDHLIGMKVQGITPDYVKQMKALGISPDSDDLIGMKVQGVSPDYIRDMRAAGLNVSADNLIGMKVQGVTPEYVKEMKATGLPDFKDDPDCYIGAKINGITPEFVKQVQSHGFKDLDLDKLIALKRAGIF